MPLTDAAKHRMLNHYAGNAATGAAATHASLHSAYSATGANELTGGTPAYARKAIAWEAVAGTATAGSLTATSVPAFDVPASSTVAWVGRWSALSAGTFLGMSPNGSGARKPFASADDLTDVLVAEDHGFLAADTVVVWGSALPTGLVVGTVYHVRDVTTDTLKLAATSGGAAIDITDEGHGFLQKIVVETFAGQGTHTVSGLVEKLED